MYIYNRLCLTDLTIEHQDSPIGIDCPSPRFAWKLNSDTQNVKQTAYQIRLTAGGAVTADTGKIFSDQSIEVTVDGFEARPVTAYTVQVTVWDNQERMVVITGHFETGRMGTPFCSSWVEPVQEPTPSSMDVERDGDAPVKDAVPVDEDGNRTFEEFRPAQYIRIPFEAKEAVHRARVYMTAHGLYRLEVNGIRPDDREFAPENTSYNRLLEYQTYDITPFLHNGKNVIGVVLADGWWAGRVGTTGDCCQYGDTLGLLLDAEIEYGDTTVDFVTGEQGVSRTGPVIFSDLFVGEKYDARKELAGWSTPEYYDEEWIPVKKVSCDKDHLVGQIA